MKLEKPCSKHNGNFFAMHWALALLKEEIVRLLQENKKLKKPTNLHSPTG